jgi:hypothetical protein
VSAPLPLGAGAGRDPGHARQWAWPPSPGAGLERALPCVSLQAGVSAKSLRQLDL